MSQETPPVRSKPVSFSARLVAEVKDKIRDEKPNDKRKQRADDAHFAEVRRFVLNVPRLPARLHAEEVAAALGFKPHDIPTLVDANLLHPVGDPRENGPKYFATVDIDRCGNDREWVDEASAAVIGRNRRKNERRKVRPSASGDCRSLAD
jgi:hypothetical protein